MVRWHTWIVSALCLCLLATAPARADPGTARAAAEQGAQNILGLLNDPAFKNPDTRAAQRQKIENAILDLFDFEEFSTRTVGPQWRQFTPEQKKDFQTAFTELLRNTYIDTLDAYDGQQIQFTGELSSNNGTRVEIQMDFLGRDKTYPAAFRMLVKNDRWVVYDIIIEGISMIKNYRDQFRDILGKGSPDDLIRRVQAKAQEQLNKSKER
ncbi:MAG: ABC transporter substrate-binding protein [Desulfovibrionaceae bacterium]|nr:ABC transporter substrate-binding protein [Desulfovibrionaceae bacterium]